MVTVTEGFKLIFEKISQYNFLTNIIPGAILCFLLRDIVGYEMISSNHWFEAVSIIYFVGVVNNRFGSLVIEWFLKKVRWISFASYHDYLDAEKKDPKIAVLNTENNFLRSCLALTVIVICAQIYQTFEQKYEILDQYSTGLLLLGLFLLFAFAYQKQTIYIKRRVEKNKNTCTEVSNI